MNAAQNTIATLEQAELLLRRSQVVNNEQVEGKALLNICGLSSGNGQYKPNHRTPDRKASTNRRRRF